jgi:hypothetical protein
MTEGIKLALSSFGSAAVGRLLAQPTINAQKAHIKELETQVANLQQINQTLATYAGVDASALQDVSGHVDLTYDQLISNLWAYGLPTVLRFLCTLYVGVSDLLAVPSLYAAHNWTRYFRIKCDAAVQGLTPTTFFDCDLYTGAVNHVQCAYTADGGGFVDVRDSENLINAARARSIAVLGAGSTNVVIARGYVLPGEDEAIESPYDGHAFAGKSYGSYYEHVARTCDLLVLRGRETILGVPDALLNGSPYIVCHTHKCSGIYNLESVLRNAMRHVAAYCIYDAQISSYHIFVGPSYVPITSHELSSRVMGGYHVMSLALMTEYLSPCAVLFTDELERYAAANDLRRTGTYNYIGTMDNDAHNVAYRWLRGVIKEGTHARILAKLDEFTMKLIRQGYAHLGLYASHPRGQQATDSSSTGFQECNLHVRILQDDADWDNRIVKRCYPQTTPTEFVVLDTPYILNYSTQVTDHRWVPTLKEFDNTGPIRSKDSTKTLIPLNPI